MTQAEEIKALREEISELRKQITDLALAVATQPSPVIHYYYYHTIPTQPQPLQPQWNPNAWPPYSPYVGDPPPGFLPVVT